MTDSTAKTNNNCPHRTGDKCKIIKRVCNNSSPFYPDCNNFKGNKNLSIFF